MVIVKTGVCLIWIRRRDGPIIDGVTEHTVNVLQTRTRDRRKHGQSSPLRAVSQEVIPI
jgi:hypothetical protein